MICHRRRRNSGSSELLISAFFIRKFFRKISLVQLGIIFCPVLPLANYSPVLMLFVIIYNKIYTALWHRCRWILSGKIYIVLAQFFVYSQWNNNKSQTISILITEEKNLGNILIQGTYWNNKICKGSIRTCEKILPKYQQLDNITLHRPLEKIIFFP